MQKLTSITGDGTGIGASAVLDIGVGESASVMAETLTGDYENLISKDDITLSSSSGSGTVVESVGDTITGNSTAGSAAAAYLNVACTAATSSANGTVTVTGTIDLTFRDLIDY